MQSICIKLRIGQGRSHGL